MFRRFLNRRVLLVILVALILLPLAVLAAPARQGECTPPHCEEPPPPDEGGGSWSGYSDGRLNPDMAEYYSIWCAHDVIEVWGGVPSPQLINTILLVDVIALGDVGSFDAGNGLTLSRSGDTIVISGSGGNGPGPASKWFSLAECIDRNGGAPEVPPPPPPPPPNPNPPPNDNQQQAVAAQNAAQNVDEDIWVCYTHLPDYGEFLDCLRFFAPDVPPADYVYMMTWALATLCAGGFPPTIPLVAMVAFVPTLRRWRRRRK